MLQLVSEVDSVPVSFKVPQGYEKEDVVEIKRQTDFFQFCFHSELILTIPLEFLQWYDLYVANFRHDLFGRFELLKY